MSSRCAQCSGSGKENGPVRLTECQRCGGKGTLRAGGTRGGLFECTGCGGSGQRKLKAEKSMCKACKGTGAYPQGVALKNNGVAATGPRGTEKDAASTTGSGAHVNASTGSAGTTEQRDDKEEQSARSPWSLSDKCTCSMTQVCYICIGFCAAIGTICVIQPKGSTGSFALGVVLLCAALCGFFYVNKNRITDAFQPSNQV